jgi:hypothetical protein
MRHYRAPTALALLVTCAVLVHVRNAPAPVAVGRSAPIRLDRAGDEFYWTESTETVAVVRARDRVLHKADGRRVTFGAVAVLGGDLFLVVNDRAAPFSRIERIPLRGGRAEVIAADLPPIGQGDLITDGRSLYWADAEGVRAATDADGVHTVLEEPAVQDVEVAGGRLYFATGRFVRSLDVGGGLLRTEVAAANTITSMCVRLGGTPAVFHIELGVALSGPDGTRWLAAPSHIADNLTCSPTRLYWSDCQQARCRVYAYAAGPTPLNEAPSPHDFRPAGGKLAFATSDAIVSAPSGET